MNDWVEIVYEKLTQDEIKIAESSLKMIENNEPSFYEELKNNRERIKFFRDTNFYWGLVEIKGVTKGILLSLRMKNIITYKEFHILNKYLLSYEKE